MGTIGDPNDSRSYEDWMNDMATCEEMDRALHKTDISEVVRVLKERWHVAGVHVQAVVEERDAAQMEVLALRHEINNVWRQIETAPLREAVIVYERAHFARLACRLENGEWHQWPESPGSPALAYMPTHWTAIPDDPPQAPNTALSRPGLPGSA